MTRNELIKKLKQNFDIRELVCPHCYKKFGEGSWQFLSTELLSALYTLRYVIFNAPITINTYHINGNYKERGLRCNRCSLVYNKKTIYLSSHCLGKGIDFNVKNKSPEEVRHSIMMNSNKFEYPIRLELNTTGWTHVDTYQPVDSTLNVIEFNG